MSDQKTLVPKLRFPEFRDKGGWINEPLEKLAKYENGKAHEQFISENGNFIVVNSKFISINGDMKKYTNKAFCLAKKGDILMVLSDVPNGKAFAKCFFVDVDNFYTVNQRICKLSPKNAVDILLFYSLNKNPFFLAFDDGVKQTNLRKDDVLSCPVLLPKSIEEQQKIADCLSSVDELIAAQAQKVDTLKTHKKGLMQQLFPREGEAQPRLRFAEFRGTGSWTRSSFEKLFSIGSGKDYKHLNTGNVPVYGSGGYMLSVTDYLYDGESVCIGRKGTINKPIFLSGRFWTVDTLFYTHSFKECLPSFIYAIFQQIDWLKHNEAGGVPSLSKINIEKIITAIPKLPEQQKIADCLSSIDELITAETQKLETLKTHKKGLMQQLFPTNEGEEK